MYNREKIKLDELYQNKKEINILLKEQENKEKEFNLEFEKFLGEDNFCHSKFDVMHAFKLYFDN